MQTHATASDAVSDRSTEPKHVYRFTKVVDGRKQPIRGLWERNGRFYAQLKIEDASTGKRAVRRVPLVNKDGEPVESVAEARIAMERLRTRRADNALPVLRRTPKFADFAQRYLAFVRAGGAQKMKRAATLYKEERILNRWAEHLGELRLDQIRRAHVNAFITARKMGTGDKPGASNRTVNIDVIVLRNVLKHAIDEGHITTLPTQNMRRLPVAQKQRQLFTPAQLEALCKAAFGTKRNERGETVPVTRNAQEFVDYLRLLAYSGARRNEALRLRWSDVDFERGQLTIGAEGDAKNAKPRVVDFNANLKAHLRAMRKRRAPDSQWLFPSPQRGALDIPARDFRESLAMARRAAGLGPVGFHDLRHLFISFCVMSGIDFMTIARWVGHQDGGVLIGKVYGHLSNEHAQRQAARLVFEPQMARRTRRACCQTGNLRKQRNAC